MPDSYSVIHFDANYLVNATAYAKHRETNQNEEWQSADLYAFCIRVCCYKLELKNGQKEH